MYRPLSLSLWQVHTARDGRRGKEPTTSGLTHGTTVQGRGRPDIGREGVSRRRRRGGVRTGAERWCPERGQEGVSGQGPRGGASGQGPRGTPRVTASAHQMVQATHDMICASISGPGGIDLGCPVSYAEGRALIGTLLQPGERIGPLLLDAVRRGGPRDLQRHPPPPPV